MGTVESRALAALCGAQPLRGWLRRQRRDAETTDAIDDLCLTFVADIDASPRVAHLEHLAIFGRVLRRLLADKRVEREPVLKRLRVPLGILDTLGFRLLLVALAKLFMLRERAE